MRAHSREREYYEDLYDSFTVETCRNMNSRKFDVTDKDFEGQELSPEQVKAMKDIKADWSEVAREITVFTYAAERYKNKSQTVDKWMRDDRDKDERLSKIEPPRHVRCRECLSTNLRLISKDEYWGENRPNANDCCLCTPVTIARLNRHSSTMVKNIESAQHAARSVKKPTTATRPLHVNTATQSNTPVAHANTAGKRLRTLRLQRNQLTQTI